MELEMAVMRMNDNQVDHDKLLESMQSDKTALSRAIAQNKELKIQLAELQNGFVKMVSGELYRTESRTVDGRIKLITQSASNCYSVPLLPRTDNLSVITYNKSVDIDNGKELRSETSL